MSYIETRLMPHSSIQSIHTDWDQIDASPDYQRNGDIWSIEKKQLLIDSLLNRYDVPKLYFHKFSRDATPASGKRYAVIDGRQRLEAIIQFINGDYPIADGFVYLEDPTVDARNLTYGELGKKYPKIRSRFDSFTLPIVEVETDDIELIEEMFSRLNEAVPLNAAEKRRAIGGDMVKAIDAVSIHPFFKRRVRFSNRRYQHKEVAVRLLFLAFHRRTNSVVDTKKPFLDEFAKSFKSGKTSEVKSLKQEVTTILDALQNVFVDNDTLLQSQAAVPVYAFVYGALAADGREALFQRSHLVAFQQRREENRHIAESDITKAEFEYLEFDRLSQQGTNDASSLRERWRILDKFLRA